MNTPMTVSKRVLMLVYGEQRKAIDNFLVFMRNKNLFFHEIDILALLMEKSKEESLDGQMVSRFIGAVQKNGESSVGYNMNSLNRIISELVKHEVAQHRSGLIVIKSYPNNDIQLESFMKNCECDGVSKLLREHVYLLYIRDENESPTFSEQIAPVIKALMKKGVSSFMTEPGAFLSRHFIDDKEFAKISHRFALHEFIVRVELAGIDFGNSLHSSKNEPACNEG